MLDLRSFDAELSALLVSRIDEVAVVFERQLASEFSAVNRLCLHVERYRGKMLRPLLVLLSGLAVDESRFGDDHVTLAAVVEMIHMATLVHDDVLDDAEIRRRGATVNHLHGNEAAVMLGDYLISNAFHLCSTIGDPSLNVALGEVTNTLCEGELAQLHHRHDLGLDEATYFEIVRRKTAVLVQACCTLGAALSGASADQRDRLGRAGEALGIAFQIRDDLLDFLGDADVVGKSLGRDLTKGKLTLAVITHLASAAPEDRGAAITMIDEGDAVGLRDLLLETGAVAAADARATELVSSARMDLAGLPPSRARDALSALAELLLVREA